nr:hypothetical protein [Citrobacter freundii]
MTTNHPAHGPVSLDRLHQIREILSKAAAQSDGGNLGYAMADAVKVIDGAIAAFGAEPAPVDIEMLATVLRNAPLAPSDSQGKPRAPVVPDDLLSMAASAIEDLLEHTDPGTSYYSGVWADVPGKLRAAMLQAGNHAEQHLDMVGLSGDTNEKGKDGTLINECTMPVTQIKPVADLYGITSPTGSETTFTFDAGEASSFAKGGWTVQEYVELERYQEAVAGNSPVTPDGYVLVPKEPTEAMMLHKSGCNDHPWDDPECVMRQTRRLVWAHMLEAAAQQEVKSSLEHGMQRYAGAMQKLADAGD